MGEKNIGSFSGVNPWFTNSLYCNQNQKAMLSLYTLDALNMTRTGKQTGSRKIGTVSQ